jgi:hypothetical protein
MPRIRSTSPPKSAWPGVSMMLMRVSPGLPVPEHRGALGQDGDAALALLVVGIHGPLGMRLVGAEHAGLGEQLVHQRGLAVVDVGDDGDVAERHGDFRETTLAEADVFGRRALVREAAPRRQCVVRRTQPDITRYADFVEESVKQRSLGVRFCRRGLRDAALHTSFASPDAAGVLPFGAFPPK